jgi:hypothetical protein
MSRAIEALRWAAVGLFLGWIVVSGTGSLMGSPAVTEVGIRLMLAAYPVLAALLVLCTVKLAMAYRLRRSKPRRPSSSPT